MVAASLLSAWVLALGHAATAPAELNPPPGTDLSPVLGYSTWSFLRLDVSTERDEAQALALHDSGLEQLGYSYFNQDDGWYVCPGPQGPAVDANGRWITDEQRFPPGPNGEDGIAALASYVHSLGLKFGIYVTPGISRQAVTQNSPILGTDYTAAEIATKRRENNYNCGGMVGIDYSRPGAQAYVNSIVDEFAQWGIDYIKLDGITNANAADIQAWSTAIRQSGRPMQLDVTEGHFTVALAGTLDQYATQWEYSPDIECYECERHGSSYPLTDYRNVKLRFTALAKWHAFSGRQFGAYADLDSVEVGNCEQDGLTSAARETVLSLWSLASSPLILGTDLTNLCPADLELLENTAVLALDQDGITAVPVSRGHSQEIFAKTPAPGEAVVGLFNTGPGSRTLSSSAARLGLPDCAAGYSLANLWTGQQGSSPNGAISAQVPAHGVALLRVTDLCG